MEAHQAVFIHSSFRTSSTWLWGKFRALKNVIAYNEPFHEFLSEATKETLIGPRPDGWESRHPAGEPYFLEFVPLVQTDGGIEAFHPTISFERFIPVEGILGGIGDEELRYVRRLLAHGVELGRKPVLACTRSLGRMAGLKQAFGGVHIFLYRRLFEQWMSYASLHEGGNEYFTRTLSDIIRLNSDKVPLFEVLRDRNWVGEEFTGSYSGFRNAAAAYEVFLATHFYLYAYAVATADLTIDASRLAYDEGYRQAISDSVCRVTQLRVDLGDASRSVQYAQLPGDDGTVERACDLVLSHLGEEIRPQGPEFVRELAAQTRADAGLAVSYGRQAVSRAEEAAKTVVEGTEARLASVQSQLDEIREELSRSRTDIAQLHEQLEVANGDLNQSRASVAQLQKQLETFKSKLKQSRARNEQLQERLNGYKNRIGGLVSETARLNEIIALERRACSACLQEMTSTWSWKASRPLRYLETLLRGFF